MDENHPHETLEETKRRLNQEPLLEFRYEPHWPLTILMYAAVITLVVGAIWYFVKRSKGA